MVKMRTPSLLAVGFPRLSAKLFLPLAVCLLFISAGRVTAQTFTTLHSFTGGSDGANPNAGLILSSNTLYGTTCIGGTSGNGTVFALNTDGTGFTTLHNFTGQTATELIRLLDRFYRATHCTGRRMAAM